MTMFMSFAPAASVVVVLVAAFLAKSRAHRPVVHTEDVYDELGAR